MTKLNSINAKQLNQSELTSQIVSQLEGNNGYVIIKGLAFSTNDIELCCKQFIDFCSLIGKPKPHDNQEIVWHIKHKPTSTSQIKTYSEHNDEAPFHTDAQYRLKPENYFALLTLKKANCGGGISGIISIQSILQIVNDDPLGNAILELLKSKDLPFAVPSVFSLSQNTEREVVFAKVLYDNSKIRYRFDTLMKGLEFYPNSITDKQKELLVYFNDLLNSSDKTIEFTLEDGDLVFINNETVLHRRTSFKDINRHLLRIRLDKE